MFEPIRICKMTIMVVTMIVCLFSHALGQFPPSFMDSIVGVSVSECQEACLRYTSCKSITFNRRMNYCSLWNQRVQDISVQLSGPRLIYIDGEDIPQIDSPRSCDGHICSDDEACRENKCTKVTCLVPMVDPYANIFGNQLKIGSKIKVECIIKFTENGVLKCEGNGRWSDVFSCEVYGYHSFWKDWYSPSSILVQRASFSLTTPYLNACIEQCNKTNNCSGVSYYYSTGDCSSTNYILLYKNVSYVVGWGYYRKLLPITMNITYSYVWYGFTYIEAIQYCETVMHTTIATKGDLNLAHELGYHRCGCGFVQGGNAYMAITFPCNSHSPGLYHCGQPNKAHVYCKNLDFPTSFMGTA